MLEIILMFYGIYALIRGQFHLIPGRIVRGPHARLAGLVLVLSPIFQFVYFFFYGMNFAFTHQNLTTQAELQNALLEDIQSKALAVGLVCLVIAIILSAIIAATAPPEYVVDPKAAKQNLARGKKPGVVSVEEAATQLHITPLQVLKLIEEHKLSATWVNGTYEINAASFDRYLLIDRHTQAWENPPAGSATPARDFATISDVSTPSAAIAPNEQLKVYEDAVLRNPNDVQALFNRARAYYSAGLTGMAALDFQRVLEMQPDHPNAASMRGFIVQYGNRKPSTTENAPFGEDIRS